MRTSEVFLELYGRLPDLVRAAVDGLTPDELARPPAPGGNTVGWLVWHLARVQDDHIAHLADQPQVWEQWQERFGLPNGTDDIGYGHTSEQVEAVRISDPELLTAYHHEVTLATARDLQTVDEAELEREVDQRWDPPVTAGMRLVSIQGDCLQHLGQAAYVKGLLRG